MKYYIIIGSSKGLGESLAKKTVAHRPDFVANNLVAHMSDPEFGKVLFVILGDLAK
jgi:hypothetical protein